MANWPLTGRSDEMDLLTALLDADDRTSGIVIAGGAGVGKTRLAREVSAVAAERGWIVRSVHGTAAAQPIPLGAFSQWIDQFDEQPLTLVGSLITALTSSTDKSSVLVVVDDVHLLDGLSAFVLHQLLARGVATVVATLRTGEPAPSAVTELWRDGHLQRLDLQPLSGRDCLHLLQDVLGNQVDGQTASRMWDLTRGNVLFMLELVRQERQSGRLTLTRDCNWSWTGPLTVSPSLAELLESYLGVVPDGILDVLDLVSVAEPLELSCLTALADPQAIEDAEAMDLVRVSHDPPADQVSMGHPLFGELRRARMGRMRARRLNGRLAQALRSPTLGAVSTDPVRLAMMWLDSDLPGDPDIHFRGAAAAFGRLDAPLSGRLAEAAVQAGAGREAQLLHARTLSMLGRGGEAEVMLSTFVSGHEPDAILVAAITLRALNLLLTQAQPEQSWSLIEEALAKTPAPLSQELMAFRALQLAMAAQPEGVMSLLDSIEPAKLTLESRINLNFGTTIAFGEFGQLAGATQTPQDDLILAADSPVNAFQTVSLALMHVDTLVTNGKVIEAADLSARLVHQRTGMPQVFQSVAAAVTGLSAAAHGDLETARDRLEAALATEDRFRRHAGGNPFFGIGYWLRIAYTEALARAGDVDSAVDALGRLQRAPHPSFMFLEPNRLLASAWVAAARGRTTEAIALADEAAEFAHSHGQRAREVLCLQTALQLGSKDYHRERLAELSALLETPRAGIAARWAVALGDRDGQMLMEVSDEFEQIGDRVAAADAAAHAAGVFQRDNLRGSKLTASRRATQLVAQCGAVTPATREAHTPLPLSDREREIASLVREGMSNKEIAETLVMSVRTVEGHIYRACNKLGLASRGELAESLEEVET